MYQTHKRWPESKLHAVCNASGQPIALHLTGGQVSDYKGAAVLFDSLPQTRELLADRGYDADWFRKALLSKGIALCIPGRRSRKESVSYDKGLYKQRHKIEIMLGRLKDWRRIATRYDRCATPSSSPFASQPLSFFIFSES